MFSKFTMIFSILISFSCNEGNDKNESPSNEIDCPAIRSNLQSIRSKLLESNSACTEDSDCSKVDLPDRMNPGCGYAVALEKSDEVSASFLEEEEKVCKDLPVVEECGVVIAECPEYSIACVDSICTKQNK